MTAGSNNDSPFRRRQLGWRLENLRRSANRGAGMSTLDVAETGIVARNTLWRIETGLTTTHHGVVRELCLLYGADSEETEALVRLAQARGRGWSEAFGDPVPGRLGVLYGAEQAACKIMAYDPEVIPGTLQTPDYARAIFIGEKPHETTRRIEDLVRVRLQRQERFWARRPAGAQLCVVLNQGALTRQVGGHATMKGQIEQLRQKDSNNGVEIRVLTWTAGSHPAIYGGYTILDLPHPRDPTVVYLENYSGGQYLDEDETVERMMDLWDRVYEQSIPIMEWTS